MTKRTMFMLILLSTACAKDEDNAGDAYEGVYDPCAEVEDCEGQVPEDVEAACIPKAEDADGFCSWICAEDADCSEEFDEDFDYLCASFESQPEKYCFPACREDDPELSEDEICPPGYECRSTGGGVENRRVCFPL